MRWERARARAFAAARRHSRRVRVLRVALPLCAAMVAGLYFVSTQLQVSVGEHQLSVDHIEMTRDTLRMVNAKMEGANGRAGTYRVTADYAEQEMANPTEVHLKGIKAHLHDPPDGWSRLTAPQGTFDTQKEHLTLFGGIDVESSSGMKGRLVTAAIDLKTQHVNSQQPVSFSFLNGKVNARSMEIAAEERLIVFKGKVRVQVHKWPTSDQTAQVQ